jgi:hypothetical protein
MWWLPLIQMAGQISKANNSRLQVPDYSKGFDSARYSDPGGGSGGMNMKQTSSLLSSVFGVDETKKKKPGIFDQLNDINKSTPSNVGLDDSTIGGAFYDL